MKKKIRDSITLVIACLLFGCSETPPSLEQVIEDARADFRVGDELDFMRLTNNAVIHNASVKKVDMGRILILESRAQGEREGPDPSPYWVSLSSLISYRHRTLLGDQKVSEPEESSSIKVVHITSVEDAAEVLSRLEVQTPRGEAWNKLGILEKKDWLRTLDIEAPDFILPCSVKVQNVGEDWGLRISGEYQHSEMKEHQLEFPNYPGDAKVVLEMDWSGYFSPMFRNSSRDEIKRLQKGDRYDFDCILRPDFQVNDGVLEIDLRRIYPER